MLLSPTKTTFYRAALALFALSMSTASVAEDKGAFFGKKAAGKWIIGGKVSNIDLNDSFVDDSSGAGIVLGYEFAKNVGTGKASFEIEYIAGEEENINSSNIGRYEVTQLNAFFTYRSAGNVFYKLKGGLEYSEIELSAGNFRQSDFGDLEEASLAGGIGIGYRFNEHGLIELEYTKGSSDADIATVSLNGLLTF